MFEKIAEVAFAYCSTVLELFDIFFEHTHAAVGLGTSLVVMVGVNLFLPRLVEAGILVFLLGPATAATITMIVHYLLLNQSR